MRPKARGSSPMRAEVGLIAGERPGLLLTGWQVDLAQEAVAWVLHAARGSRALEVELGAGNQSVRSLAGELLAARKSEMDDRHSTLDLDQAHVVHSALLTSTRFTSSEEHYKI